jgi:hypothetical protein
MQASPVNTLKMWLRMSTKAEKEALASAAGTKLNYLYFLSNPDKPYGRQASAEMAQRLEAASDSIRATNPEVKRRLPRLLRTDLSPTCRGCAFARRCLGDAAIASEFEYLDAPGGRD